jgi:peptide/nickel transport system substrate-binding protein
MRPELAESYEVSDDNLELTFQLRQGVRWHDGEPFTSADVMFTFDTVRDPAVLAPTARANLEAIESYEAPDAYTFRIRLREPSFLLFQYLEELTIIPQHIFSRGDINTHPNLRRPVGTGPFRFVSLRAGREGVLERNDDYWGEPARLDRVIYRFARDRTLAYQMLQRGDIDVMPRISTSQVEQASGDSELLEDYELQTFIAPGFNFLVYNTARNHFSDRKVRQAFTMLIDRQTILCSLESCLGRIVSSPFPVGHPGADPDLEPWPFDPPRARELLDEAGWRTSSTSNTRHRDGRPFRVTFLVPAISTTMHRIATLIQEDLLRAGVQMDIHSVDWSVFLQRLQNHDFDLAGLQFTLDWETDYYTLYHSSQAEGGMNYGAWDNEEADQLLEDLRRELDVERRVTMQRELHRILRQEQPHTFLLARVVSTLTNRSLNNAVPGIPWYDERTFFIPTHRRTPEGRPRR